MSKAYDKVKVENQCDLMVIGPETQVHHHRFTFVVMVPRQLVGQKPSGRFKVADLGRMKGTLSRKEIYGDLA